VPVLEVDGQLMSQSGAILVWLAETTGHFAPAADQRFEALRWIMFDNHKFTNNHAMHRFQRSFMPEPVHPAILSFLRSRTEASFAIAEKHLANRAFMLGEFTPVQQRGAVLAIYGAIYTFAGMIAPSVMGIVIQNAAVPLDGYMTGFTINAVVMAASGLLGLLLLWPNTERARLMGEVAAQPKFA